MTYQCAGMAHGFIERRQDIDLMPARDQVIDDRLRKTLFKFQRGLLLKTGMSAPNNREMPCQGRKRPKWPVKMAGFLEVPREIALSEHQIPATRRCGELFRPTLLEI